MGSPGVKIRRRADDLPKEAHAPTLPYEGTPMNYWRMRMRKGNRGQNLLKPCVAAEIAAITYDPVKDTDLSRFSEDDLPSEWKGLEPSQSGSLKKFAWRVRGGDVVYGVGSYPSCLMAVGRVRGTADENPYRYSPNTPIIDEDGHRWKHTISVDWERLIDPPIRYPKPRAGQNTVLDLYLPEANEIKSLLKSRKLVAPTGTAEHENLKANDSVDDAIERKLLESSGYTRYSKEAIRVIQRKHADLCNQFTGWLERERGIICNVERKHIDVTFFLRKQRILVEFKIAYTNDPKPAIREALGQVLEYNLYPDNERCVHWMVILDCAPTERDLAFLKALRGEGLPLSFGWRVGDNFKFSVGSPLRVG